VLSFCFVFLRLVFPVLPVSLNCPSLIAPSVFSSAYWDRNTYVPRKEVYILKTRDTPSCSLLTPSYAFDSFRTVSGRPLQSEENRSHFYFHVLTGGNDDNVKTHNNNDIYIILCTFSFEIRESILSDTKCCNMD